jgi:hypothetical protein
VLVHSHGSPSPEFSGDDRRKERALFGAFSRILDPLPTGSLLLGPGDAAGSFWINGRNLLIRGDALNALTTLARLPEFAGTYLGGVRRRALGQRRIRGRAWIPMALRAGRALADALWWSRARLASLARVAGRD